MLAAATNGGITLTSPSTLKRASSNIPTTIVLCGSPSALAWSLDRNTLFYAQGDAIHHYTADNSSNEGPVYTAEPRGSTVSHVVCPTTSSLVYATERAVTFTNASHTERCVELDSPITSLTSVYDSKHVVYTTSTTATFHNIATHTAISLGGLLLSKGAAIAASAAHHHSSERIVLVGGSSLFIYDINHTSAPVKTIDTSGPSPLDFVTCSPFSRTLVAVGSTSGMVQLVDLEKEKSVVRALDFGTTLTSLTFSPDGGSLYVGTKDGYLLVQNLRDLETKPKRIVLDPSGGSVIGLCVQKKDRSFSVSNTKSGTVTASSSRASLAAPAIKPRPAPVRTSSSSSSLDKFNKGKSSPSAQVRPALLAVRPSNTPSPKLAVKPTAASRESALSPSRDPLGNVHRSNPSSPLALGKSKTSTLNLVGKRPLITAATTGVAPRQRIESSVSQAPRRPKGKSTVPNETLPAASRVALPRNVKDEAQPSPDLPIQLNANSSTSMPAVPTRPESPGLDAWLARDRSQTSKPTRGIAFASDSEAEGEGPGQDTDEDEGQAQERLTARPRFEEFADTEPARTCTRTHPDPNTLQVSPVRPAASSWPVPSPLRKAGLDSTNPNPNATSQAQAQELLRSLFSDVLSSTLSSALTDLRVEQARGVQGLHLDLLRAQRGWRTELREQLDGVRGELQELREENAKLREENERLRRGY